LTDYEDIKMGKILMNGDQHEWMLEVSMGRQKQADATVRDEGRG